MRIQLLSDLHLEVDPSFQAAPAEGADLLVLAGDIGSHAVHSRLGAARPGPDGRLRLADGNLACFGLDRFSPRSRWPVPVLYVPGNHEYDGQELRGTRAHLQALCAELGITWLEGGVVYLDAAGRQIAPGSPEATQRAAVRVIGSTLWADFDALGPRRASPTALAEQLEARRKAFAAANWYLQTVGTTVRQPDGSVCALDAAQVRDLGLQEQAWLRAALGQPFSGATVVVTHFAPSLRSADPRYGLTPGTAGFCNALDETAHQADCWLHGHLHCPSDYQLGRCRVVANPLGYAGKHEQDRFVTAMLIDV